MDNPVVFFSGLIGVFALIAGFAGAGLVWLVVGAVLLLVALIVGGVQIAVRERPMR